MCFGHEKYLSSQFNEPELLAMGNSTRGDAGDEANSARQHTHRASLRSLSISVMLNGFLSDLMAAVEAASSKFNALNPAAREIRPDDDVTVTEFGSTLRLNLSVDENFRVSKQDGEGERKKLITGHKYAMQQPQKTEQSEASTPLPRRRGWGARNHISHRKKERARHDEIHPFAKSFRYARRVWRVIHVFLLSSGALRRRGEEKCKNSTRNNIIWYFPCHVSLLLLFAEYFIAQTTIPKRVCR